jgi:thymidylate kinase
VTSPDIALERIKKRDRKGEELITLDYIIKLNQYHDDWLNFENCISIDGNKDKYAVLNKIIVSLF